VYFLTWNLFSGLRNTISLYGESLQGAEYKIRQNYFPMIAYFSRPPHISMYTLNFEISLEIQFDLSPKISPP